MPEQITLVFDIDGTLCPIKEKEQAYADLVPYAGVAEKLREYKAMGARIVLHTARNMNSCGNNVGLINATTAKTLLAWLDKWEIPYDEIFYGKPWAGRRGIYVDDRTVRPDEFMRCSFDELERLCEQSREGLE
jgi:capsule biosynthesis phosphatase